MEWNARCGAVRCGNAVNTTPFVYTHTTHAFRSMNQNENDSQLLQFSGKHSVFGALCWHGKWHCVAVAVEPKAYGNSEYEIVNFRLLFWLNFRFRLVGSVVSWHSRVTTLPFHCTENSFFGGKTHTTHDGKRQHIFQSRENAPHTPRPRTYYARGVQNHRVKL